MAAPHITAYYRGEHLDDPSGGLLWTMLDRLEDLPFSDSMTLVRRDVDDVFLHVVCRSDGYRLMVQDGGQPMLAYPVEFDATFNALLAWTLGRDAWRDECDWRSLAKPPTPTQPPALIPIGYDPESSRTDMLGRYADGQFLALVHGNGRNRPGAVAVAVFLFDHAGTYAGCEIHRDVPLDDAGQQRERMVTALPDVRYGDIAIRTFSVDVDGVTWSLVDRTEEYGAPRVCFYPLDIMFYPPWDGTYDT